MPTYSRHILGRLDIDQGASRLSRYYLNALVPQSAIWNINRPSMLYVLHSEYDHIMTARASVHCLDSNRALLCP